MKRSLLLAVSFALAAPAVFALEAGDRVPDLAVPSTAGEPVNLGDVPGWKVVYFYPKSFTPGCTKQACGLRDAESTYEELGATVFGVSVDDIETQKKFKEKYNLPFELLADDDKELSKAFDALNLFGMAKRITFIVNPEGVITDVIDDVSVGSHDQDVAEILRRHRTE